MGRQGQDRTKFDLMNNNSWMDEIKDYKKWKENEEEFSKICLGLSGPKNQTYILSVLPQIINNRLFSFFVHVTPWCSATHVLRGIGRLLAARHDEYDTLRAPTGRDEGHEEDRRFRDN